MKKILSVVLSAILTLTLVLSPLTVTVSAESYISQSAAGERVIRKGVPEHWQSKNGYVGFYTKHIMVYGIPVLSTDDVEDWVLFRAYDVLEVYLRKIYYEFPELIDSLIKNKSNVIVIGLNEYNIQHPDWTAYEEAMGEAGKTERRGGGAVETTVLVDDLGIQDPNNWFSDFCGIIHEFTHTMLGYGIGDEGQAGARPDIFEKINAAYEAAYEEYTTNGKYSESSYDMNNYHEYFAGQVGRWFNANGTNLNVEQAARKTERQQLKEYDPAIYEVCKMLFGEYDVIAPWGGGTDSMIDKNEVIIDYSPLARRIGELSSLDEAMFDAGVDVLHKALDDAKARLAAGNLTGEDIAAEVKKLDEAFAALTPKDGNLAVFASPSTTFVSSWENLSAVNDGKWSEKSNESSCPHYGTWGNQSASETVTYTWEVPVEISSSDLYIWTDSYAADSGVAIPASYLYEYLDEDGQWHEVTGADDYSVLRVRQEGGQPNLDGFNLTNFDKIKTTAFRVTLNKQSTGSYGVGIVEWRVYGKFAQEEIPGSITVENDGNGTASASADSAVAGTEILLTAEANTGYHFKQWQVLSGDVTITDNKFIMPEGDVTVKAIFEEDYVAPAVYTVTVVNGSGSGSYEQGETVTIVADSKSGYEFDKWVVDSGAVSLANANSSTAAFVMPDEDVVVTATYTEKEQDDPVVPETPCDGGADCPINQFDDAIATAWYHDGVHYCLENDIMLGHGNNLFGPNDNTTRAQIVTMLWRLEGEPDVTGASNSFTDVSDNIWYTDAVAWAVENKIVEGYGDDRFGPSDRVTREQLVTIMWRYAKHKSIDVSAGEDTSILTYEDADQVSQWAVSAMQWACGVGLVKGTSETVPTLEPKSFASRAQIATIFHRYCEEVIDAE